jgi:hypothetical protein
MRSAPPTQISYRRHPRREVALAALIRSRYAARMTTVSKHFLIVLALSAAVLAQSAPGKSHAGATSTTAASAKGKGQKDEAATNSASHPSTMSGNHKDVMGTAANPNQASTTHSGNMIGNHKDVMEGTAPAPSTAAKPQSASAPVPPATPAATKGKSAAPDPKSPR